MTNQYVAVQWNRHKRIYDAWIAGSCVLFMLVFVVGASVLRPGANLGVEVLVLRGLGALSFSLLHVILAIGPLARLSPKFSALLYNRRHLGVAAFIVGLLHGMLSLGYYGGFGVHNPFVALFGDGAAGPLFGLPFEAWGLFGLLIMFVMAATSHDFWLKNLGAGVWKKLHMLVYPAYLSLVLHVGLGAIRAEGSALLAIVVAAGVVSLVGLHLTAAFVQASRDAKQQGEEDSGNWMTIESPELIADGRAKVVCSPDGTEIAVFRHGNRLSALSNRCAHQGGPLGEGKIVDGCVTCPWHGYQYLPEKGQSPPPYSEKIATFKLRDWEGQVQVNTQPLAPGTETTAVCLLEKQPEVV